MKKTHYIANLRVQRVEIEDVQNSRPIGIPSPASTTQRKVGEVVSLVIRGADLEALKSKVRDHLLVVDDDLDIPLDDTKGVTRGD